MRLTNDNYYSIEANKQYMSASQLKDFMDCEAKAIAQINGEWEREETTAMLVGSFVDAHFSGEAEKFKQANPAIYTRTNSLRAEFKQAEEIIQYIQADNLMMQMLAGETQKILTGAINGIPFKGKLDFLLTAEQCAKIAETYPAISDKFLFADGAIVDLKIMRDMASVYTPEQGRVSFIKAWRYDQQLAIYQALEGRRLPCFIVCATKEKQPDKAIIHMPQYMLDLAIDNAFPIIERAAYIKERPEEAKRCEKCDYCKNTKLLTEAISADDLDMDY